MASRMLLDPLIVLGGVYLVRSGKYNALVSPVSLYGHKPVRRADKKADTALRWHEILLALLVQAIPLAALAALCYLAGVLAQFILVWLSALVSKNLLQAGYVIKGPAYSMLASGCVLLALSRACVPLWASVLMPVVLGGLLSLALSRGELYRREHDAVQAMDARGDTLTDRELLFYDMKQKGMRQIDIAEELEVSERTVRNIEKEVERKLGIEFKKRGSR